MKREKGSISFSLIVPVSILHLSIFTRQADIGSVGDRGKYKREEEGNLYQIWFLIFVLSPTFVLSFH